MLDARALTADDGERRRTRAATAEAWIVWIGILIAVVWVMQPARTDLEQAHVVLTLLLVVLGASAGGGRPLGLTVAFAGFLIIDYFFQPPFDTLTVAKPLDWLVLFAFLATAIVATQLLSAARAGEESARARAREIDRIAALGAETINALRPEDALTAIAAVIRDATHADRCDIYVRDADDGSLSLGATAVHLNGTAISADSGDRARPRTVARHALIVRGRDVGELLLSGGDETEPDPAAGRLLGAFAYYAALGVERVRLASQVEHVDALREADRLKDAILAAVSHDLRTPLTTIKALAHDIARRGEPSATIIEEQADRLNHVVTDLLEWSRLSIGGITGRAEINAAEDLVGAALRQTKEALRRHPVRTMITDGGAVLVGRFDFVQSLRILTNLLENAAKYAPAETIIDISAAREGNVLVFRVADRGPGVSAGERERIFSPFYRPPNVAPDVSGAGLGLAIARRLAELQGGTVNYEARDGGGAQFVLAVPADATPQVQ